MAESSRAMRVSLVILGLAAVTLAGCSRIQTFDEDQKRFSSNRAAFEKLVDQMGNCPHDTFIYADRPGVGRCGTVTEAEIAAQLKPLGVLWVSVSKFPDGRLNNAPQQVVRFVTGSVGLMLGGQFSAIEHWQRPIPDSGVSLEASGSMEWVYCYMDDRHGASDCQTKPYRG